MKQFLLNVSSLLLQMITIGDCSLSDYTQLMREVVRER
jgi:hypothetical protein